MLYPPKASHNLEARFISQADGTLTYQLRQCANNPLLRPEKALFNCNVFVKINAICHDVLPVIKT